MCGFLVLRCGLHHFSEHGTLKEKVLRHKKDGCGDDDDDVLRIDHDIPDHEQINIRRAGHDKGQGPESILGAVLQKDGNTDGTDDDRQEAPVPERVIGYPLKNIADSSHEDYHERINDIGREFPGIEHEHRHKSREHDQFPLGKIDDVRCPVDQDDTQRYERIDGAHGQACEKQLDIDCPIHIRPPSDWRYRPS